MKRLICVIVSALCLVMLCPSLFAVTVRYYTDNNSENLTDSEIYEFFSGNKVIDALSADFSNETVYIGQGIGCKDIIIENNALTSYDGPCNALYFPVFASNHELKGFLYLWKYADSYPNGSKYVIYSSYQPVSQKIKDGISRLESGKSYAYCNNYSYGDFLYNRWFLMDSGNDYHIIRDKDVDIDYFKEVPTMDGEDLSSVIAELHSTSEGVLKAMQELDYSDCLRNDRKNVISADSFICGKNTFRIISMPKNVVPFDYEKAYKEAVDKFGNLTLGAGCEDVPATEIF